MAMSFAENLSALRRERGWSQRKVSAELHISQALLSHYENGLREPRLDFVVKVCDYYGVTADYMLGRTGVPNAFLRLADELGSVFDRLNVLTGEAKAILEGSKK